MDFAPEVMDKTYAMLKQLDKASAQSVDLYRWLHKLGLEIVCA
jgi:hypothetical protein